MPMLQARTDGQIPTTALRSESYKAFCDELYVDGDSTLKLGTVNDYRFTEYCRNAEIHRILVASVPPGFCLTTVP